MSAIPVPREAIAPQAQEHDAVAKTQRAESPNIPSLIGASLGLAERFGLAILILGCLMASLWWYGTYIELPDRTRKGDRDDKLAESQIEATKASITALTSNSSTVAQAVSLFAEVLKQTRREDSELLRDIARDLKEIKSR